MNPDAPPGDAQLITAALDGKAQALDQLVERYAPQVYRFAMRVCRDQEDAREILQDTFVNAIRSLGTFRGDSQFATWLFRIVVTSCAKARGKRRVLNSREIPLEAPEREVADQPVRHDLADWSQDPEASSLSMEVREALESAIVRLPPGYKGVFLLRDIEGFSTADTARILTLSPEAVKTRLHRARLFLRDQLSRYFAER